MVEGSKFELVEFERVDAAHGTVLLRIAARVAVDLRRASPKLIVRSGAARQAFSPLPAPPGFVDLLRLSYPVPARLLGPAASFTLEFPDGAETELPAPSRHEGAVRAPQPEGPPLGWDERLRAEARHVALVELERRLELEQGRRRSAEAQAEAAGTAETDLAKQLERANEEAAQLRAEHEEEGTRARAAAASAEATQRALEQQLRELTDAASRTVAEIDALRGELANSEEKLATREAEIDDLRGQATERAEQAEALRIELAELREDESAHRERIAQLEQRFEEETAEHELRTRQLEDAGAALSTELEESRREADALRAEVRDHEQRASELAQQLWSAGELQAAVEAHVISRGVEADLLRTSVHEWEREAAMARAETEELKRSTAELDLELARVTDELSRARQDLGSAEARGHEVSAGSTLAMDTLRQELRRAQERAVGLEEQLRRAWDAQTASEARVAELSEEMRALREQLGRHEELEGELATRNVEIGLLREALEDPEARAKAGGQAAELEQRLGELQERLDAALSEAAGHRDRSAQLEREAFEHQSRIAELAEARRRVDTLEQARLAVKDERDGLAEQIRQQSEEIAHLWAGRTEVEHALARWQLVHQESITTIETLKAESADAIERYAQEAAAREAVNSLLEEIGRRGHSGG